MPRRRHHRPFQPDCTEFIDRKNAIRPPSLPGRQFSFANVPTETGSCGEIEAPDRLCAVGRNLAVTIDKDGAIIEVGNRKHADPWKMVQLTKTDREYPDNKLTGGKVYRSL